MKILGGLLLIVFIVFIVCLAFIVAFGYWMNIIKLTQCDFESSYKAEIIRSSGIIIAPVGIIAGYMDIGE